MIPIVMPDLQLGSAQVVISTWLMNVGENVIQGDRLVEILLPGVTIDIPAPSSGQLTRIETREQSLVKVGDILGWIEPEPDLTEQSPLS